MLTKMELEKRGAVSVAENGTHQLWHRAPQSGGDWSSWYVRLNQHPGDVWTKHAWWLAYDGWSFAGGRDFIWLSEHDPQTLAWVEDQIFEFLRLGAAA
jgi:hypothetical protein